jgi:hypothetical protein
VGETNEDVEAGTLWEFSKIDYRRALAVWEKLELG